MSDPRQTPAWEARTEARIRGLRPSLWLTADALFILDRLDAARRDAARYRYVRDELSPEDFATTPAEELDAFVDECMKNG